MTDWRLSDTTAAFQDECRRWAAGSVVDDLDRPPAAELADLRSPPCPPAMADRIHAAVVKAMNRKEQR